MNKNVYKYDDIKRAEHMAVRNTVDWYRFTHQLMEVSGPAAAAVLDSLYTAPVSGMKVGKNKYSQISCKSTREMIRKENELSNKI